MPLHAHVFQRFTLAGLGQRFNSKQACGFGLVRSFTARQDSPKYYTFSGVRFSTVLFRKLQSGPCSIQRRWSWQRLSSSWQLHLHIMHWNHLVMQDSSNGNRTLMQGRRLLGNGTSPSKTASVKSLVVGARFVHTSTAAYIVLHNIIYIAFSMSL